jgi:superkiller protein 3
VQITPDDAEAWEHLGAWREEQGLADEAIDAYRKAADLTPESSGLRFSLAEALRDAEHYDEAIDAFKGLVQEHSNAEDQDGEEALADAYSGLAASLNLAGRYDEALKTAEEYLQRFPDDPEAFYEQASAYDALGRHDEAITSYEQARIADPLNPTICNDLADTYLAAGRTNDAVEMAETAVSLDPEMAVAYETLAQTLVAAGRQAEADEAMQRAAELHAAEDAEMEDEDDGEG